MVSSSLIVWYRLIAEVDDLLQQVIRVPTGGSHSLSAGVFSAIWKLTPLSMIGQLACSLKLDLSNIADREEDRDTHRSSCHHGRGKPHMAKIDQRFIASPQRTRPLAQI